MICSSALARRPATIIRALATGKRVGLVDGTELNNLTFSRILIVSAMRQIKNELKRISWVAGRTLQNGRFLLPLLFAKRGSTLRKYIQARPQILGMVVTPYISVVWDASTRIQRIKEHCEVVEHLGRPFNLWGQFYEELDCLGGLGAEYRVMLDTPPWMIYDGLLSLSIWLEKHRIFVLSFSLARTGPDLVAYIGGIQGQRGLSALETYRDMTRRAHGLRPRDLLIELFRMIAESIDVTRIYGVSDAIRYSHSDYFAVQGERDDRVLLNYDAIWQDRGATLLPDGFFELDLQAKRRDYDKIAPKKRAMYRRRYEMLDEIGTAIRRVLHPDNSLPPLRQHLVANGNESLCSDQ